MLYGSFPNISFDERREADDVWRRVNAEFGARSAECWEQGRKGEEWNLRRPFEISDFRWQARVL
jgi:hypothetical protein